MTLRVTSVIMAYAKSDQVKQSIDSLEKYRLFTKNSLELFICKELNQCGSLFRKIMLEGEMYYLLTQLPVTVETKKNLVVYSRSFLPVWYRAGVVYTEYLLIFGTYLISFIIGFYVFHGLNTLRKLQKQANLLHSSVYLGIVTRRIYEIQYK